MIFAPIPTLGFTGTRHPITDAQWKRLTELVNILKPMLAVHGAAEGVDSVFHKICVAAGIRTRIRPAHLDSVNFCPADEVMPVRPPLERDSDIVADCDLLLATPLTNQEVMRSGTWATIRRARKAGKGICIIDRIGVEHWEIN